MKIILNSDYFTFSKFCLFWQVYFVFIFEITQNSIVILLKLIWENRLVKSVKFLLPSIKSMNPMQKYPHILELLACTRKMLAIMFLFLTNSLIYSGTSLTPKLTKQTISLLLQNKVIQCVPTSAYSSRFITYAPSFIILGRLSLEKNPSNLGSFS